MILDITGGVLVIILVWCILKYIQHIWSLSKYPNGPFPLPIIGNFHLFAGGDPTYMRFIKLREKYGDVFSVSMGMERVVIISSIETIREAMISKGNDFASRPSHFMAELESKNGKGIAFKKFGKPLLQARKMAYQCMTLYGNGFDKIESMANQKADVLYQDIKKLNGKPVDVKEIISCPVLNVAAFGMIFGENHTRNDTKVLEIQQMVTRLFRGLDPTEPTLFMPWIRHLYHTEGFKSLMEGTQQRDRFLKMKIDERSKNLDPNNVNGAIDALLLQNKDKEPGVDKLPEDEILMILSDLILASSDTLIENLRWIVLLILHHPQCQEQIYQELSSFLSTTNTDGDRIRYNDVMAKLPYLQATILESIRYASLNPITAHKTTCDTSVDGKPVPKGATVLFNNYFAHHDKRHWGDTANEFDPARWFDETNPGKLKSEKDASFLPFGAGTRKCIGEKAGRMIVAIFTARLFAKFKVIPSPVTPNLPDCRIGTLGLARCVIAPVSVVLEERY